jgi:hypothetical protein
MGADFDDFVYRFLERIFEARRGLDDIYVFYIATLWTDHAMTCRLRSV